MWVLFIVASALLLGVIKRCPRHPASIYRNPKARHEE